MPAPSSLVAELRAESLRRLTRTTHQQLDDTLLAHGISRDRQRFSRFVDLQYRFHLEAAPLYARADLAAHFLDLPARARLAKIEADMRSLEVTAPLPSAPARALTQVPLPRALGWLYVAEGSTLGAAVILKLIAPLGLDARFGASHLAPGEDGVALPWRRFTTALNAISLLAEQESEVIDGAQEAFSVVNQHMRAVFS
ncbi:MAG TPA: biliverdin-producing heme oxygenase [Stenotrophomonas sp.]|nr:biliverdin-producing heme oxygenase [Stenotrophomonas sp.]